MIDELTQKQNIVLATGGGAILSEQNRRFLSSRGRVVYLSASQQ
jgi:shikimate kinase